MSEECWLPVVGFEGLYEVSDHGAVRGRYGRLLRQGTSNSGYRYVGLWRDNKVRNTFVHRIVLSSFAPREGADAMQVNHVDGIKEHNVLPNLEWVTPSQNMLHAVHALGFKPPVRRGAANHNARAVERVGADGSVTRYPSIADAVAAGYLAACIVEVCRGTQKRHRGFVWRYRYCLNGHATAGGRAWGVVR